MENENKTEPTAPNAAPADVVTRAEFNAILAELTALKSAPKQDAERQKEDKNAPIEARLKQMEESLIQEKKRIAEKTKRLALSGAINDLGIDSENAKDALDLTLLRYGDTVHIDPETEEVYHQPKDSTQRTPIKSFIESISSGGKWDKYKRPVDVPSSKAVRSSGNSRGGDVPTFSLEDLRAGRVKPEDITSGRVKLAD